jgi:hypothetical protein
MGPGGICAYTYPLLSHGRPKRLDLFVGTRAPVADIGGIAIRARVASAPAKLLGKPLLYQSG